MNAIEPDLDRPHAGTSAKPALLVSIHDVSPLTLDASRQMVDTALSSGVPVAALTVLVIPNHEGIAPLDKHPSTCAWLRDLLGSGACLCLHGSTHRMTATTTWSWQWAWAHAFARGQGELYRSDADDCRRRLDAAEAIMVRAGLADDIRGFVPPAWLMSTAAQHTVERAGFAFHERLSGIVVEGERLGRRLIGFGSLGTLEARATAAHAWFQSHRRPADTRLAMHPQDMLRSDTSATIRRTLKRLVPRLEPMNYNVFCDARGHAFARASKRSTLRGAARESGVI